MPTEKQIDYLEPGVEPPPVKKRPPRTWLLLLLVWAVGMIVWSIYLVAIAYLTLKIL